MWDKISFFEWEITFRKANSFDNIANHEHTDYLHFIVNYMGHPILIDSGLASYMSDHEHADARNAEYHNSLLIDDCSYKPFKNRLFSNKYYESKNTVTKTELKSGYKVVLKTSGFNRIDKNINFERHIMIDNKSLTISDISSSKFNHKIENYFHFDPKLRFMNDSELFKFTVKDVSFEFVNYKNEISNNNLNQSSMQYGKTQLKRVLYSKNTINNKRAIIHKLNIL